jgi:hypothetical protein
VVEVKVMSTSSGVIAGKVPVLESTAAA